MVDLLLLLSYLRIIGQSVTYLLNCFLTIFLCNTCLGVPASASGLTVLLITVERYIIITNPFHGVHLLRGAVKYAAVVSSWALSLICMMVIPFIWTNRPEDNTLPTNYTGVSLNN